MVNGRLSIWVFGPIGAGKTHLLSHLPLERFRRVDQDAELEKAMQESGLPGDTTRYTDTERTLFTRVRERVSRSLWDQVPAWREAGENLCFETTGAKSHLFEAELIAGRAHGYRTLGCAMRCPLHECLTRNRANASAARRHR